MTSGRLTGPWLISLIAGGICGYAQTWSLVDPQPNLGHVLSIGVHADGKRIIVASDPDGTWFSQNADPNDGGYEPLRFAFSDNDFGAMIHMMRASFHGNRAYVLGEFGHIAFCDTSGSDCGAPVTPNPDCNEVDPQDCADCRAEDGWIVLQHDMGDRYFTGFALWPSDPDKVLMTRSGVGGTSPKDAMSRIVDIGTCPPTYCSQSLSSLGVSGTQFVTDVEIEAGGQAAWAGTSACYWSYTQNCTTDQGIGLLYTSDALVEPDNHPGTCQTGVAWEAVDMPASGLSTAGVFNVNNLSYAGNNGGNKVVIVATEEDGVWKCQSCQDPDNPGWTEITPSQLSSTGCDEPNRINDVWAANLSTYFATACDGVYRTTNGGTSWSRIDAFPHQEEDWPTAIGGVTVSGAIVLYVGYENKISGTTTSPPQTRGAIYRSGNAQAAAQDVTALEVTGGHGGFPLQSVAIKPDDDDVFYATSMCQGGIWEHDGGRALPWRKLDPTGAVVAGGCASLEEPEHQHAAGEYAVSDFHYPMRVVTDPAHPDAIHTTSSTRYFRSTDAGVNWKYVISPGGHKHGLATSASSDPASAVVYVGSGHGKWPTPNPCFWAPAIVWKSNDGGSCWNVFVLHGSTPSTACSTDDTYWPCQDVVVPGLDDDYYHSLMDIAISPRNPEHVYAATFGFESFPGEGGLRCNRLGGQGVLRSFDGGASWTLLQDGLRVQGTEGCGTNATPTNTWCTGQNCPGTTQVNQCSNWVANVEIAEEDGQDWVFIATLDGVYVLPPGTTTWESIGPDAVDAESCTDCPDPVDTRYEALAVHPLDPDIIYVGTSPCDARNLSTCETPPRIYHSTDRGTTWAMMENQDLPENVSFVDRRWGWSKTFIGGAPRYRVRDIELGGTKAYAIIDGSGVYEMDVPFEEDDDGTCVHGQSHIGSSPSPARIPEDGTVTFWSGCPSCDHTWSFSPTTVSYQSSTNSSSARPIVQFQEPGIYDVTVTVESGASSCVETSAGLIQVYETDTSSPLRIPELVVGPGSPIGLSLMPPLLRGINLDDDVAVPWVLDDAYAYGTLKGGLKVGMGSLKMAGDRDILTGPGPSDVFGPHVRGWSFDSIATKLTPLQKVSFFAYGTLRYGVNVAGANVDGDAWDEILTGPGPGSVFGPHARAFNWDADLLTAISKINFFAWNESETLYGLNIAGGNVDGGTQDEILVAPGPAGSTYNPASVKGYKYNLAGCLGGGHLCALTGLTVTPWSPRQYGAEVAAGDIDDDGVDEFVVGQGAGPLETTAVKAYNYSAGASSEIGSPGFTPLNTDFRYGANVAVGTADGSGGRARIMVGPGPHSIAAPLVDLSEWTGSAFDPVATFAPFGDLGYRSYGINLASMRGSATLTDFPGTGNALDSTFDVLRILVNDIPADEWGDEDQKTLVVDALTDLQKDLPDLSFAQVVDAIDAIAEDASASSLGIENAHTLTELLAALADLRAQYDPPRFASTGVSAELEGFGEPGDVAVSPAGATVFVATGDAGAVARVGSATLLRGDDLQLPTEDGDVHRMHVPAGRQEAYGVSLRDCAPDCAVALERLAGNPGVVDAGYEDVASGIDAGAVVRGIFTMPPSGLSNDPLANAAWIALDESGTGTLKTVVGISNFNTSTVSTIGVSNRVYYALARTPIVNERVYAAHSGGVDGIRTRSLGQPTSQNELVYPGGFGPPVDMASGTTEGDEDRLFVISADDLLAYEPTTSCTTGSPCSAVDSVALDGDAVAVDLSPDGRFVLVTRHPVGDEEGEAVTVVTAYDADTLDEVRESATALCGEEPCDEPPPAPMGVAVDDDHAIVSEPGTGKLVFLYLDAPRRYMGSLLETVIRGTPDDMWVDQSHKAGMIEDAVAATLQLELAETATTREERAQLLRSARQELDGIRSGIDGCFEGYAEDDVLKDCYEARGIWNVTEEVLAEIARVLGFDEPPARR